MSELRDRADTLEIHEMESNNDVSQVINRTAFIENLLNQVIINYACPRKDTFHFFWDVLLDSSIMSLGSKVKVAIAISQRLKVKLDQNSLHKLMSYRNAFAHQGVEAHPRLFVCENPEEDELHYMLHIITHSGKTQRKRRDIALTEFNDNFEVAKKSLVNLLNAVKAKTQELQSAAP